MIIINENSSKPNSRKPSVSLPRLRLGHITKAYLLRTFGASTEFILLTNFRYGLAVIRNGGFK